MKKYYFLFVGIMVFFMLSGCGKDNPPTGNDLPVVYGTISCYKSGMAIGGESDPSGYILTEYRWTRGKPAYAHTRVYIEGSINPSWIDQKVRASGEVEKLTAGGVETPRRHFPLVHVEDLKLLW